MKHIAVILMIGVWLRHGSSNWLADGSSLTPAAWFYVLGGTWEVVLCAVIAWLIAPYRRSMWKWLTIAGCTIGALEGAQMSVCRLAIRDIRNVPHGMNLCDYASGLPLGSVFFTLYAIAISYAVGASLQKR